MTPHAKGHTMKNFIQDTIHAAIMAALIGAPFAYYFWSMTP